MINYSIIKKCLSVRLFCLLLLMFSATIVFSQKRTISGNVVDEIKEPLIGVTVQIKGTTQGTVTATLMVIIPFWWIILMLH